MRSEIPKNGPENDGPQKSENFYPEEDDETRDQSEECKPKKRIRKTKEAKKAFFPQVEDLEMAEGPWLAQRMRFEDFPKVKATYRIAIAQYHPDKVSALGSEIRDVAEKKAKEINQAYELFRKKSKNQ